MTEGEDHQIEKVGEQLRWDDALDLRRQAVQDASRRLTGSGRAPIRPIRHVEASARPAAAAGGSPAARQAQP